MKIYFPLIYRKEISKDYTGKDVFYELHILINNDIAWLRSVVILINHLMSEFR